MLKRNPAPVDKREPLPWDHPRVRALRAIDAAWLAAVAEQERITGKPYPECFAAAAVRR